MQVYLHIYVYIYTFVCVGVLCICDLLFIFWRKDMHIRLFMVIGSRDELGGMNLGI